MIREKPECFIMNRFEGPIFKTPHLHRPLHLPQHHLPHCPHCHRLYQIPHISWPIISSSPSPPASPPSSPSSSSGCTGKQSTWKFLQILCIFSFLVSFTPLLGWGTFGLGNIKVRWGGFLNQKAVIQYLTRGFPSFVLPSFRDAPSTPPGFVKGVDWRALVKD